MLIQKIYHYAVLFATLIMIIGGSISAFMAAADIVRPEPYYQTFDQYKAMKQSMAVKENGGEPERISEQQLKQNYETEKRQQLEQDRLRAENRLIKSIGWIAIPLPFFIYFQRRTRRVEKA
ncbi:MAG TPA: hypothetical protein VFK44_03300 [Bacillales bacterium]|nr:hypothetical protein [Bacillales bacterium]